MALQFVAGDCVSGLMHRWRTPLVRGLWVAALSSGQCPSVVQAQWVLWLITERNGVATLLGPAPSVSGARAVAWSSPVQASPWAGREA